MEMGEESPLYKHQHSLPRLPVPTIQETLQRFVPTALPLARSSQETTNLLKAVQDFPHQAQKLQQRLLERSQEYHDSSWLQHWWNTEGYLKVRDSVVINVSYYFHFKDDPTASTMFQRGAALLYGTAQVRNKVLHGTWPAEQVGKHKTPLCSVAYKYMFHSCRIPRLGQDTVKIYNGREKQHAVVACRGHFFVMDILDAQGEPLPVTALEAGLEQIHQQAISLPESNKIGYLTSSNRDSWAKARETLMKTVSPQDLEALESGAVMLCLDDEDLSLSRAECAKAFLHGNGYNRWFDKSLQLIVLGNGKAGLNGEHSMMDGMPVVSAMDHITRTNYASCLEQNRTNARPSNVRALFQNDNLTAMLQFIEKGKSLEIDFPFRKLAQSHYYPFLTPFLCFNST